MEKDTKEEMKNLITALKTIDGIPWARLNKLVIDWEVIDDGDGYVKDILPRVKISIKDSPYA